MLYVSLRFEFHVVICAMISAYKAMFGSYLPPVVCSRTHVFFMLFVICFRLVMSNAYCVVFFLLALVYHKLPVSLDCPLVFNYLFSKVY